MKQLHYLILLSFAEIIGDFAYANYANTGLLSSFGIGTFGYIGVIYYLIKSLKGSTILYVNGMWDGISALLESIAAFIFLGERFKKLEQYIGIGMIILGLLLLKSKD